MSPFKEGRRVILGVPPCRTTEEEAGRRATGGVGWRECEGEGKGGSAAGWSAAEKAASQAGKASAGRAGIWQASEHWAKR